MTMRHMRKRKIEGCLAGTVMPYAVLRRAGMPIAPFERLVLRRTSELMERISSLEASCREIASVLPPALHNAIGKMQSNLCRPEILQLRRDIHNNRICAEPGPEAWAVLAELLAPTELEQLKRYFEMHRQHASLLKEAEQVFGEE